MFNFLPKKGIALVLSGGGARGFYHIGVIKAIQELGIKIKRISGTSIGAIMGSVYASNPDIDIDEFLDDLDSAKIYMNILSYIKNPKNSGLEKLFKKYITARDFSDFKIPMTFNAVDINTASEVVFDKGPVFPAIFSSMCIPGIFTPVKIDGRYLVDGGVLNNTPISLVEKYCDKIIVSDITTTIEINDKTNNFDVFKSSYFFITHKLNSINNIKNLRKNKKKKAIILRLDNDLSIIDFRKRKYEKLVKEGYDDVMRKKKELLSL